MGSIKPSCETFFKDYLFQVLCEFFKGFQNISQCGVAHPIGFNYGNPLFIVQHKNDPSHAIRSFLSAQISTFEGLIVVIVCCAGVVKQWRSLHCLKGRCSCQVQEESIPCIAKILHYCEVRELQVVRYLVWLEVCGNGAAFSLLYI